eukprot:2879164-Rhodomonas_salina.2
MRRSARIAHARPISAPMPDALSKFLDQGTANMGPTWAYQPHMSGASAPMPAEPHYTVEPPQFRPTTTLSGGVGGGFGTGGGFGSTGGFHTQRLQPWEEPKRVDTGPGAPFDVPKLSKWAPSVCATAAAHAVNKLRAETDDNPGDCHFTRCTRCTRCAMLTSCMLAPDVRAVVDEKALAAALKAEAEGGEYVMEPERYAFLRVQVPAPRLVQPPPGLVRPPPAPLPRSPSLPFSLSPSLPLSLPCLPAIRGRRLLLLLLL